MLILNVFFNRLNLRNKIFPLLCYLLKKVKLTFKFKNCFFSSPDDDQRRVQRRNERDRPCAFGRRWHNGKIRNSDNLENLD